MMNLKDILQNDDNQEDIIEKLSSPIYVTKRSLKIADEIYKFPNITGFGIKRRKKPPLIPLKIRLFFFVMGLIFYSVQNSSWGNWMMFLALAMQCLNWWYQFRKLWSLIIYLPSGKDKVILSEDKPGLMRITYTLYKFLESEEENGYVINIDQKHANIGVGYAEQIH